VEYSLLKQSEVVLCNIPPPPPPTTTAATTPRQGITPQETPASAILLTMELAFVYFCLCKITEMLLYIAPYRKGVAGKSMNVTSLSSEATPSAQVVSAFNGQYKYLTWSYDSSSLNWVWGPVLYELTEIPDLGSCKNNCLANTIKTYNLTVSVASEVTEDEVYFYNAKSLQWKAPNRKSSKAVSHT